MFETTINETLVEKYLINLKISILIIFMMVNLILFWKNFAMIMRSH